MWYKCVFKNLFIIITNWASQVAVTGNSIDINSRLLNTLTGTSTNVLHHNEQLQPFLTTNLLSLRNTWHKMNSSDFNPLTPVPAVTGPDEPWPFFHFWRHHSWPNLALSILNFCRRKRSLQWYPDHSDRPNGAWDMHKNAQKVEWKTQCKTSCHYTWLLQGKNCPSRWRFLESFFNRKQAQ